MKLHLLACAALVATAPLQSRAQLLISELMPNPSGSDSPKEWVELIATENIDFSITPFSVIFSDNNSTAGIPSFGTNGWATGANVTYGFEIIAGTVSRGDVVYVGGTGMSPTGIRLRQIDTGTTGGDGGVGLPNAGGVLGNGGSIADGVGVFKSLIANITSSLRPVDAIIWGNAGHATNYVYLSQYQLPQNDNYAGGAVDALSFIAPDPGGNDTIVATGVYNTELQAWEAARQWSIGALSDQVSAVALSPVPEPSTLALLASAVACCGVLIRRKRR
jgi:hypothetical protein